MSHLSQTCGCDPHYGIMCPIHYATRTVGSVQTAIVVGDLYDYQAAADALIARLGWDESDAPEIIEALKAARRGQQV